MTDTSSSQAAIDAGTTKPAGADLTDAAAVAEVAAQTSSDRKAEDFFQRESAGTAGDKSASETTADEVAAAKPSQED